MGQPPGSRGNIHTVNQMKKLARARSIEPLVRELALNILRGHKTNSHAHRDEAIAIGTFVQKEVDYVKDILDVEQIHDPLTMIEQIQRGPRICRGDCDDMSLLIATLLMSIGHHPFFRIVRYFDEGGDENKPYNHIYVVTYVSNNHKKPKRLAIDAIIKNKPIGYEVPHKSGAEIPA